MRRTAMPARRERPRRTKNPMILERPGPILRAAEDPWTSIDPEWPIASRVALRRDHYTCARCGQPGTDPHHRIARGMGGRMDDPRRHAPERLITLCRACHSWAHAHPLDAGAVGLVIQHEADATLIPVRFHYGLALLTEDGRVSTLSPRLGR